MLTRYKVAVAQMSCVLGDKKANIEKCIHFIQEAVKQQAKLIVFPELFSTGYSVDEWDLWLAESLYEETIHTLQRVAMEQDIYIAGAMIEKGEKKGTVYDTSFLLGPTGLIGKHRKIHLWKKEKNRFLKGEDYTVFETDIGNIGLQTCYEIGFPEGSRILSLKGADLVLNPSAFVSPLLYAWEISSRARALENGIYVIAANRTGTEKEVSFAAHSRVVAPNGSVLTKAGDREGIIYAEVDLEQVRSQRKELPFLKDLEKIKILHQLTDCLTYQI